MTYGTSKDNFIMGNSVGGMEKDFSNYSIPILPLHHDHN